jgi:hypothetical protein
MKFHRNTNAISKFLVSIVLFSISSAIYTAHQNPAQAYELSIYNDTPFLLWATIGICILVPLLLYYVMNFRHQYILLPFVILSAGLIYLIPLLRGYFYWGVADPLTHLGRLRLVLQTDFSLISVIYPNTYSIAALLHYVTDLNPRASLLLLAPTVVICWTLTMAVIIRNISERQNGLILGGVAAAMMIPVTPASLLVPHPATLTAYFFASTYMIIIIFNKLNYLRGKLLITIFAISLVFWHPLTAFVIAIFFAGYKFMTSNHNKSQNIASSVFILTITAVFASRLLYSVAIHGIVTTIYNALTSVGFSLFTFTSQTSSSASSVGTSFINLIIIEFSVAIVFAILSIVAFIISISQLYHTSQVDNYPSQVLGMTFGAFAIFGFVIFMSVIGVDFKFLLRNISIVLTTGTIIGAVLLSRTAGPNAPTLKQWGIVFLIFLLFSASLLTALPTTLSYQQSRHVTESTYSGYEMVFDTGVDHKNMLGIRAWPYRYHYAISGAGPIAPRYTDQQVGDHFYNQTLHTKCSREYLAVGAGDFERETSLYNGFRYNESDFYYLQRQSGISTVYTNDGFKLYKVCSE